MCCVGFGYPGANTNADRLIEEATTGYSRVFWKYENIGSMQWGVQYAYAWLYPWVAGTIRTRHMPTCFSSTAFARSAPRFL